MKLFEIVCLNSMFLFIFFNTNFIYEYGKLFKLINKINLLKEYESHLYQNEFINFVPSLGFKNNFLCKLISCPLCLNFWSSLILSIISGSVIYIGIIYMVSIIIYLTGALLYGKYKNI